MVARNPSSSHGAVLLVDDSAFARRKARQLVEELGYSVIEAASGGEAVAQCEASAPDLVLLDVVMAGMDGIEVLRRLRQLVPTLPVIVVTADIQDSTSVQMKDLGAAEVLGKPLSRSTLQAAIATALSRRVPRVLNANHLDALAELINIGYGRAAAALSSLTRERILLQAPSVVVCAADDLGRHLALSFPGQVACVNQVFSGPITGNAMLLLDAESAVTLTALLDPGTVHQTLDEPSREAISEVGNILLSACLGVFGNLLHVQVTFAIPNLHVDTAAPLVHSLTVDAQQLHHTVLVKTRFTVSDTHVTGFLVILLSVTSLDRLISAVDRL